MWFRVPLGDTVVIKTVVNLLHGASLLLDDIQDSSVLRRGKPATHIVFGSMLTINSAGYRFLDALAEVRKLESEQCLDIFCGELGMGTTGSVFWGSLTAGQRNSEICTSGRATT